MNKKYIVFDLDDTLYYELDFLKSAYREIAQALSPADPQNLLIEMLSKYKNQEDVFGFLSVEYSCTKEELLKMYREHFPDISLRKGVREILDQLQKDQVKMGLVTDGRSLTQRNKINALQIEPYFEKIVISDELGSEKPDERNFRIFVEDEYDYIYVADNPQKDFVTPNILGWKTVMIEDDEEKRIHRIPDNLDPLFEAQQVVRWKYFYNLIK